MVPIPWVLVHPMHLKWCLVCDPVEKKFTSKFSYLLFCNPTHKTETGTGKCGGNTNSKPPGLINHYDGPFKNNDPQAYRIYDTLFCRCTQLPRLLPSHRKVYNYAEPKPFCLSQTDIFSLFFIQFYCGSGAKPSWSWS
jgi:hypothetical protein